jgi:hypothetical protein
VYLDSGFDLEICWQIMKNTLVDPNWAIIEPVIRNELNWDKHEVVPTTETDENGEGKQDAMIGGGELQKADGNASMTLNGVNTHDALMDGASSTHDALADGTIIMQNALNDGADATCQDACVQTTTSPPLADREPVGVSDSMSGLCIIASEPVNQEANADL